ncbi:rhomboid family protein [Oceanobacillus manasiensis]|uniref:rhomboid family protein n=1 Tax=Oceanobacillus manasiensis TaxID=586413 RepID=UPI0005A88F69|nr:rhomboid family intramembrane serine protease [Oceanobacillus manasiensis]
MYVNEQYSMYQMAYHLVTKHQFELLYINNKEEEIWLEQNKKRNSNVIRLVHKGFDWKNHLRNDIAVAFQHGKALKKVISGKFITIHNVYFSSHPPVDEWEFLKKPMQLNEKNATKMHVYYITDENSREEKSRLYRSINVVEPLEQSTNEEMETAVLTIKKALEDSITAKKKEIQDVFFYGKPFFTYILLAINLFLFVWLESRGGSEDIRNLIASGAKYNPAIIAGEWWRIISSMFLHIGVLHLMMNMLAVYYLGSTVERIYGSIRFIIIYFLAGIGGGIASFAFSFNVSAGASGALFGLFGALLFFGLIYKKIFFQTMGRGVLIILAINIVFGFLVPQIDYSAHLGGLTAGFIVSAIIHLPGKRRVFSQLSALIIYILLISGLIIYGLQHNENSQEYHLMHIDQLLQEEKYQKVVEVATEALTKDGELKANLLFQRSYAYIQLDRIEEAQTDLEKTIEYNSSLAEAHYNLAIIYTNKSEMVKAKEAIERANQLNPEDENITNLHNQLMQEIP